MVYALDSALGTLASETLYTVDGISGALLHSFAVADFPTTSLLVY